MADGLKCFIARPEFRPTTGEISVPTQSCQGPGSRNVLALERFECRHRSRHLCPPIPADRLRSLDAGKVKSFDETTTAVPLIFVQEFLTSSGIEVNAPEELPRDAASGSNEKPVRARSAPPEDYLKKFLKHDGQVLRFGCVWDRRSDPSVTGDDRLKPYVLRYFLVDDSIQINDAEFERNQRRGLYGTTRPKEAVFVRRQKLPKGLSLGRPLN